MICGTCNHDQYHPRSRDILIALIAHRKYGIRLNLFYFISVKLNVNSGEKMIKFY